MWDHYTVTLRKVVPHFTKRGEELRPDRNSKRTRIWSFLERTQTRVRTLGLDGTLTRSYPFSLTSVPLSDR